MDKHHAHEGHVTDHFAREQFARAVCAIKVAMALHTADTSTDHARHVVETAAREFLASVDE